MNANNSLIARRVLGNTRSLLAAAGFSICLMGCASSYSVYTVHGDHYQTKGEPKFVDGGYEFVDASGTFRKLPLSEVRQVK